MKENNSSLFATCLKTVFESGGIAHMARKVFVRVLAEFDEDGRLLPQALTWEDGRRYVIDRVLDICPGVSLKVGGSGIRYTCRIHGRQVYLFQDENRWYMEGRDVIAT